MARAVVTGAAGFIGSTLVDALLARGDTVVGVDCYTPYYDLATKLANLRAAREDPGFQLHEADLATADLRPVLEGAEVIYHQAGQPGVRPSWSSGFADYVTHNVLATQRLLGAATEEGVPRVVYASSSSVYGQAPTYPTDERDLPAPHSPYGVTKLAAEHLCGLYAANWGLSTVALRYFTVYGPRQRPDMAIHRLVRSAVTGEPFPLFGDGTAVRDFTFVDDVVRANIAAASADVPAGTVLNIAGGSETTVTNLIELVGHIAGSPIAIERRSAQPGDVDRTGGAIERARSVLGWTPRIGLEDGIAAMVSWQRASVPV